MEEELKGIEDVEDVKLVDKETGEVILSFDTLKVSNLESEEIHEEGI